MSDAEELERAVTERTAGIRYSRLAVWKDVLFHPAETLEREAGAASLKQGAKDLFVSFFAYMLIVLLIYVLIYGFVIGLVFGIVSATTGRLEICGWPLVFAAIGIVVAFVGAALISAAGVVSWLTSSAVLFALARLAGGEGEYTKQAYLYALIQSAMAVAMIPFAVLSMMPCVGMAFSSVTVLLSAYAIYLQYKAMRITHGLGQRRAAAVVLVPVAMALLIIVAAVGLYFFVIFGTVAARN